MANSGKTMMLLDELLKMHPEFSDDIKNMRKSLGGDSGEHEEPDGDEAGLTVEIEPGEEEGSEEEQDNDESDSGPGFSFKDLAMGKKKKKPMMEDDSKEY